MQRVLGGQLGLLGIGPLYGFACDRFGVLSLPAVSVWTNGRVLWWRAGNDDTTWAAADPQGAVRQLAAVVRVYPE